jgi:DNA-binding transcriptional LysR family regulator
MNRFTLNELQCFDAVVRAGGFQAAAELLHRSHPSVFAAVAKLEKHLGLALLDRSGYRVGLTEAGRAVHDKVRLLLRETDQLQLYATQLAMGAEAELRVVLGDLCPAPLVLELLSRFFTGRPGTRLHLSFEAVTGPWERLLADEADVIVHRVPPGEPRVESIDLGPVAIVPVAAPGFLPFSPSAVVTSAQLQPFTQCVMRDSAREPAEPGHFLLDGAPRCSVPDHRMKKEVILQGLAWGHVPRFLIEDELRAGRLLSIAGRHVPGVVDRLAVVRRNDRPHGPVADELWRFLAGRAPVLPREFGRVPQAGATAREPGRIAP